MINIFVKKPDGSLSRISPELKKFGEGKIPFSKCKGLKPYIDQGLEWFISDESIEKSDIESRRQIYWEEVDGKIVFKKDYKWEKYLMTDQVLKKRYINSLKKEAQDCIDNNDAIGVAKKQQEIFECGARKAGGQNENPFWIEKAIQGLDRRVAGGESDKPEIRKKLEAKLKELQDALEKRKE